MAMVARYFGVDVSTDGSNVNPGDLNSWLNNSGGYKNGTVAFDHVGSYTNSAVKWVGRWNVSASTPTASVEQMIRQDLQNGNPVIARVINPSSGHRHFVVLTGLCGLPGTGGYMVSDPGNIGSSNWGYTGRNGNGHYALLGIRRFSR